MIPTSCEDLSWIGHTVNGIFLVDKAADISSSKLKLTAVFCDFQPPSSVSNSGIILNSLLPFVDLPIIE